MGAINPVPNVLCVHNNIEPRSQQSSSKSRVTRKNSPSEFGLQRGLDEAPKLEIPLLAFNLGAAKVQVAQATAFAVQATLLATQCCVRSLICCVCNIGFSTNCCLCSIKAAPGTKVSKWMIHEFYANAVQSDEEIGQGDQHPYKSYVRGVDVDFSPQNIKRVLRFKDNTPRATTDYTTRLNSDQRLDKVLQDLFIPGATWRLSSGQPAQPIQLRRAELTPLARRWHEFIIHSIIPTENKSEITIARVILIHSIIRGEDVRVEEIIAENIAMIAQGKQGKGTLAFPSTIFKLCKDVGVSMREFRGGELIPQDKMIIARLMETTRFGRNVQVQQHNEEEEEDQPMPQFEGGNEEDHNQGQHQHF
ncbi:hypothetical protein PIB30_082587 [Stylosanthes scabra]|uniref:Putative plant transposon protein domain-containing protein n=1 Tax=Stylosanthes scabra TaxID=79078 RepID=A0ABU6UQU1_9FABA|nr:hypothetical protein [Stylosanthes scabra]